MMDPDCKRMSNFPNIPEYKLHVLESEKQKLKYQPKKYASAAIGSEIECDKDILDSYSYAGWQDIHHDLLIICAAVEFADRRWLRSKKRWARRFHITAPVRELEAWLDEKTQQNLCDALRHLTGDNWRFSFVSYRSTDQSEQRQMPLFPNQHKKFAIAYSDGLDSRCVAGLYNENDAAVRVRVSARKQHHQKEEHPFNRLPFNVKVKQGREGSVRSRGFKFAAITAIAAHISKVKQIIVPESGQGALGPILLPLSHVYPDYRNHPTFFRRMERFIQTLLGIDLAYIQPRLWHTKGQTIAAFLSKPGVSIEQVVNTRSCWQTRFNVRVGGKMRQCGICAACLLRRMSLHAAGIEEPLETYVVANLKAKNYVDALPKKDGFKATETLYDYGYMGARHLQQLADLSNEPDTTLKPYVFEIAEALDTPINETQKKLRGMLIQHAEEWSSFAASHGKESFLNLWTKGGRHG